MKAVEEIVKEEIDNREIRFYSLKKSDKIKKLNKPDVKKKGNSSKLLIPWRCSVQKFTFNGH